ncbi:MAG TPA: chemotaxis protein CheD [Terracidiphilus sp.]|jgi:chemotaxis protein CheD|nr:chemotaxis protein CheD [Terracidiphilus sp.]
MPPRPIYVQPGDMVLTEEPSILQTVLGSCVGITFQATGKGIAALCHPMLPCQTSRGTDEGSSGSDGRFVDSAIREVGRILDAKGVERPHVVVKVFGGSDVLPFSKATGRPTVGHLNAVAARQALSQEGFVVAAERLGGTRGLHLTFDTVTGEVLIRRLKG